MSSATSTKCRTVTLDSFPGSIRKRASSNAPIAGEERVGEAPLEDTIGYLCAMSGYRVLERAAR